VRYDSKGAAFLDFLFKVHCGKIWAKVPKNTSTLWVGGLKRDLKKYSTYIVVFLVKIGPHR
jgi:hypothetical protein